MRLLVRLLEVNDDLGLLEVQINKFLKELGDREFITVAISQLRGSTVATITYSEKTSSF